MYDLRTRLNTTALRERGFQHVPGFFTSEALKVDLAARAAEIVAARDSGAPTTVDQDVQGFPDAWHEPLMRN